MAKRKNMDDLFDDDNSLGESSDFASMFEQSLASAGARVKSGDKLRSEILSIGKEECFVSTGTPIDAVIPRLDMLDENGQLKHKVGDFVDIIILKVLSDEIRATLKGSKSAPADLDSLEDAFDMELPVEGRVTEVVKGGYRVAVHGQKAFCPISQMDLRPVAEPESLVGRKFEFLITQFEPQKRNVVVSRRKLLEMQKIENEGVWMQEHQVGDVLSGTVVRLENFGAFVELGGGVEGLVHVSEIGFTRIQHASEALQLGEKVQVKIQKISDEGERLRISLSIKEAGGVADPWNDFVVNFKVGSMFEGTVDKKANFGLFVSVVPGVTGLLPKSKWQNAADSKKYEDLKRGDAVKLQIDEIKYEERKVSLGLPGEVDDESWRKHQVASGSLGSMASALSQIKLKK